MNINDFLFQEQIMAVVQMLAGYSDSEADEFRKVISKKIRSKMPAQKERFTQGALKNGLTEEEVSTLWAEMESFSAYAFNKSHAVSYAILSMQTAWLKAYYPVEFYAANISYEVDDLTEVVEFISEARKYNIRLYPPSVNKSMVDFWAIDNNSIRFGLAGISGIGHKAAQSIIDEREENGEYKTITDFIMRTNPNSNVLKYLIYAGAFDELAMRKQLLHPVKDDMTYIDMLFHAIRYYRIKDWVIHDTSMELIPLPITADYSIDELINMEYEVTKLYLSASPFDIYRPFFDKYSKDKDNADKNLAFGHVIDVQQFKNKNGIRFLVYNGSDIIEYSIFRKQYDAADKKKKTYWMQLKDKLVIIEYFKWKDRHGVNDIKLANDAFGDLSSYKRFGINIHNGIKDLSLLQKLVDSNEKLVINFVGENFNYTTHINNIG